MHEDFGGKIVMCFEIVRFVHAEIGILFVQRSLTSSITMCHLSSYAKVRFVDITRMVLGSGRHSRANRYETRKLFRKSFTLIKAFTLMFLFGYAYEYWRISVTNCNKL